MWWISKLQDVGNEATWDLLLVQSHNDPSFRATDLIPDEAKRIPLKEQSWDALIVGVQL